MSFPIAMVLVALSGFIALSYELVWYRAYSFVTEGSPASFGALLGAYLLGIALGSLGSRAFCRDRASTFDPRHLRALAGFVFSSSLVGFAAVPAMARLVTVTGSPVSTLPFVAVAAGLQGAILPLISHFGISPDDRAGARLSYLYMSNIAGSAAGSLLTGFVLMDHLTIQGISVFLYAAGAVVTFGLLLLSRRRDQRTFASLAGVGLSVLLALLVAPGLFHDLYARLLWKRAYTPERGFAHVVETKSGVITVTREGGIYGGGIYDGAFSTNLVDDRNHIIRAYALSALHPAPRRVLMVGLASGSWAQVIAHHPQVESLTIIEINPGYLEIIPRFPEVASLLRSSKVEIVIDDGRRWLARHPDRRFDFVVQNTTWHFRAHATNLLSTEYLALTAEHLAPGGVLFFNTTGSRDAQLTAAKSFPHAYRVLNFMAVGNDPIVLDKERWRRVLTSYEVDGRRVFDLGSAAHRERLEEVLSLIDKPVPPTEAELLAEWRRNVEASEIDGRRVFDLTKEADRKRIEDILSGKPDRTLMLPSFVKPEYRPQLEDRESILATSPGARVITDDNMVNEWRPVPPH